jgi:hypothetical protein
MNKCPRCMSGNLQTERRPNGNTTCLLCGYKDASSIFGISKEEQKLVLAHDQLDLTYTAIKEIFGSDGVERIKARVSEFINSR